MKVNTFKKYPFTADLYTFYKSTDSTGQPILTYQLARNINIGITASGFGRMYVFFKAEDNDAVAQCQLQVVKDVNGTELRPGGTWQLSSCEAYMNQWGEVQGYKGQATFLGSTTGTV